MQRKMWCFFLRLIRNFPFDFIFFEREGLGSILENVMHGILQKELENLSDW